MVDYTTPLVSPIEMQWDSDSRLPLPDPGSAPSNCGPACVQKVAGYYTNNPNYSIYSTRRLAVTDPNRGTSAGEQRTMLERRGVQADVFNVTSLAQLKAWIASGRRPAIIGIEMARVPLSYRDHPFTGWHAVVAMANASVQSGSGIWIMDPNFSSRTNRLDPDKGKKFYPDWLIQDAFIEASQHFAIVPKSAKVLQPTTKYANVEAGANIRRTASGSGSLIDQLAKTTKLVYKGDVTGGSYSYYLNGKLTTGNKWSKVMLGATLGYVIKPFCHPLSGAEMQAMYEDEDQSYYRATAQELLSLDGSDIQGEGWDEPVEDEAGLIAA
jgi:hypothetical protein